MVKQCSYIFCLSLKNLYYVILYTKEKGYFLSGPCMVIPFPQCTVVSQRFTCNGPYWEGLALGGAGGLGRLANLGRLYENSDPLV